MKLLAAFVFTSFFCMSIVYANENIRPVSMVSLISNPAAYDKLTVEVAGFFEKEIGTYLFLTEQHAKSMDLMSGVTMGDTSEGDIWQSDCKPRFVKVTGTFVLSSDDLSPLLTDITKIYDPALGANCWELKK